MALSTSWYEHRLPSTNVYVTNRIFHGNNGISHRFSNQTHPHETRPNIRNLLPYLLSLGMLTNNAVNHDRNANVHIEETTGPFKTLYSWRQVDFAYDTFDDRQIAIDSGEFIQENNLPLGIEVYKDRVFISLPKWKEGVPATLAVVPRTPKEKSPLLEPYPNWKWHNPGSCSRLTSVFRMQADICGRLWVLDSGQIDVATTPKQLCPPQLLIFDLSTDKLILRYELPEKFVKQDSLYSNIAVDIRGAECETAHAYLTDVWRFGLVVFSLKDYKSWRITDHLFYPDPLAAAYNVNGLDFQWTDGIFGIALSPQSYPSEDRTIFFNPMSSFRQFYTKTSIVRNETGWMSYKDAFRAFGQSRGKNGQSSTCGMDRRGILFFNLVTQNSVGCWDSRKSYKRSNLGIVAQDNDTLVFPNDLKIDNEFRQSVWIITNRLPFYIYDKLDVQAFNFRIMSAYVDEAVKGTICDPNLKYFDSFTDEFDECV